MPRGGIDQDRLRRSANCSGRGHRFVLSPVITDLGPREGNRSGCDTQGCHDYRGILRRIDTAGDLAQRCFGRQTNEAEGNSKKRKSPLPAHANSSAGRG
jgi:hypothetical protein